LTDVAARAQPAFEPRRRKVIAIKRAFDAPRRMNQGGANARRTFRFRQCQGSQAAALIDNPAGDRAPMPVAHCFTCGKDVHAARALPRSDALGIACCAFDSPARIERSEFANTTSRPTSPTWWRLRTAAPPTPCTGILIGHSWAGRSARGGADVPEARAVATIAAPCDPDHVTGLFKDKVAELGGAGEVAVKLGGREFRIRRAFLDGPSPNKA